MIVDILKKHQQDYPEMEIIDIITLLYQTHNEKESLEKLRQECKLLTNRQLKIEDIGNHLVRVHLCDLDELELLTWNQLFVLTANTLKGSMESFQHKLEVLKKTCKENSLTFNYQEVCQQIHDYEQHQSPQIGHSKQYHTLYQPHYRILTKELLTYYPVLLKLNEKLLVQDNVNIAIDGKCGSGKSTFASILSQIYDVNVFHMDDFFLQRRQRTKERFQEPGGNVDYERFKKEVIERLKQKKTACYQRFDCLKMALHPSIEEIPYKKINVIEGTYSMHPYFGSFYDFTVALNIKDSIQLSRILKRNGEEKLQKFKEIWIPLENAYFNEFSIFKQADIEHWTDTKVTYR